MANIVPMSSLEMDPLKKDFRNYLFKTWMSLFGEPPTARMYELAWRLQNGPARDVVMGFRGMAKSYITVTFGTHALYCDPTEIVLTLSGSGDGAKGNANLAFTMINGFDWLAHMKPRGILRSSAQAFDVMGSRGEKSESFAAMSLFGQITGRRASLIIPDDVETPNTSATDADRSLLRVRYAELGGAILKPGGRIKVLGTAQTELTLYTELATQKGYGMMMIPAIYPRASTDPKKDEVAKYGPWLAPSIIKAITDNPEIAGEPTEPTRFSLEDLAARELEYGTTEFQRQFLLDLRAGLTAGSPLKLRDIPILEIARPTPGSPLQVPESFVWNPLPENRLEINVDALPGDGQVFAPTGITRWTQPEGKTLVIDPSGGGLDETAWGVITQHLGRVGLVHMDSRLEGFAKETLEAIAEDAKAYGVFKVRIEKNYGGGMFGELLRPYLLAVGHPCTIEEENAGTAMKEQRIVDTLQPVISAHRLWIAADVLRKDFPISYTGVAEEKRRFYRLTYQLTRMVKKKNCVAHDDRVDMLAAGVGSFIGVLRRQLEDAANQSRDQYLLEQQEKILETLRQQANLRATGKKELGDKLANFLKGAGGLTKSPFFRGRGSSST